MRASPTCDAGPTGRGLQGPPTPGVTQPCATLRKVPGLAARGRAARLGGGGRDSNPATPYPGQPGHRPGDARSTKAGTPTRRHPALEARSYDRFGLAQRRPGLQPGDTPPWRPAATIALGSLNEGRDSNPATPRPGGPQLRSLWARSTKAGTPTRRHPALEARSYDRFGLAQRRPGLQPGDTLPHPGGDVSFEGRSTKAGTPTRRHPWYRRRSSSAGTAQRRPGLQPGDTPGTAVARRRQGPLNEGRDSNPATPVIDDDEKTVTISAQRRPGLQPGDTVIPGFARTSAVTRRSTKAGTPTRRHPCRGRS